MIKLSGRFITLEGGEGAGKSTNLQVIVDLLKSCDIPVTVTREPGGTELGEKLRSLLLGGDIEVVHDAELLLMFAARAEHVQTVIIPSLSEGKWVVCDRFTDSSYAYQGGGRGVPMERIKLLEKWVQGDLRPDCTLLFDLPVEAGMGRARQRSALDRFEKENIEFMQRIRSTFLSIASMEPDRMQVIDANQSPDKVAEQVRASIQLLVEQWRREGDGDF